MKAEKVGNFTPRLSGTGVAAMARAATSSQRNAIRAKRQAADFPRVKTAAALTSLVFIDRIG